MAVLSQQKNCSRRRPPIQRVNPNPRNGNDLEGGQCQYTINSPPPPGLRPRVDRRPFRSAPFKQSNAPQCLRRVRAQYRSLRGCSACAPHPCHQHACVPCSEAPRHRRGESSRSIAAFVNTQITSVCAAKLAQSYAQKPVSLNPYGRLSGNKTSHEIGQNRTK